MGRQICFFMSNKDEQTFLNFLYNKDCIIINDKNSRLLDEELEKRKIINPEITQNPPLINDFYIKFENSNIIIGDNGFIDQMESDIIEILRCRIKNGNQLWNGRIWYQTKYYDKDNKKVTKEKWLDKKYNEYKKWITSRYKLNKQKGFYIGEDAYRLYKEQGFKMMNAPKVAIEFD